jgi:hypothetical protein
LKSVTKASVSNIWDIKSLFEKNHNKIIPTIGPTDKEREIKKGKARTENNKDNRPETKEDNHNKLPKKAR